jgi:crossover junction endodeoxyribonuclease RusA
MIILPYPPSANRLWRNVKGRMIKSAHYRAWIAECAIITRKCNRVNGPFRICLKVDRPDRRKRDLDNLIKPVLDALKGAAFDDDSDCQKIEISWGGVCKQPFVYVWIQGTTEIT